MRDFHAEFVYRKINKPNKPLAWLVCHAFKLICKTRNVKFSYDDEFLKIKDEQMIVLCQHRSRIDYIYVFAGLNKTNVHILCGYQNIFQKGIYTLLKHLGVIAKMLYQPDPHATIQMLRASKQGGSLVIFPEGIQSTSGSTHPINPATMKLLAKMKLPVAVVSLKGAYFSRTRYSADIKKGKIEAKFMKLFDKDDFEKYSTDVLYEKLLEKFQYNEFEEHKHEKVAFCGKKPNISGLDNIIYKCPHCNSEYRFFIENDSMSCLDCGFKITMDKYYDIKAQNGTLPFANIDEWYKWQRSVLTEQVKDDGFSMSTKVKIGRINSKKLTFDGALDYYGEGVLTLNNKGLTYKGTSDGELVEIAFDAMQVYSLSMSLQYDLDLYYRGNYYNFKLLENETHVAKWMLAAEEIHNLHDNSWCKVSREVYS